MAKSTTNGGAPHPSEGPALMEEPPKPFTPSVELPSPHHYRLVRDAVKDRADTVKALAKKLDDEGYLTQARVVRGDATALEEDVLPQFEHQAEIPLATADEVGGGIANELRGLVRRHARRDDPERDHEAELLKELAERITRFATEVAERAFAAGAATREYSAEVFALKSLNGLRRS